MSSLSQLELFSFLSSSYLLYISIHIILFIIITISTKEYNKKEIISQLFFSFALFVIFLIPHIGINSITSTAALASKKILTNSWFFYILMTIITGFFSICIVFIAIIQVFQKENILIRLLVIIFYVVFNSIFIYCLIKSS